MHSKSAYLLYLPVLASLSLNAQASGQPNLRSSGYCSQAVNPLNCLEAHTALLKERLQEFAGLARGLANKANPSLPQNPAAHCAR